MTVEARPRSTRKEKLKRAIRRCSRFPLCLRSLRPFFVLLGAVFAQGSFFGGGRLCNEILQRDGEKDVVPRCE